MLTAEKNRLGSAPAYLRSDSEAHVGWLERRLSEQEKTPDQDDPFESACGRASGRSASHGNSACLTGSGWWV